MNKQDIFKYNFQNKIRNQYENFYTNSTNIEAFESINSNYYENVYLFGPKKSGKSYLGSLWKKK